jgi:hypothetical protein
MSVIVPIVHLNGDRFATLMDQLTAAYDAVCAAEKALQGAAPNARNYYPVDGLFEQAVAQHRARQAHLVALRKSLAAEMVILSAAYPNPH